MACAETVDYPASTGTGTVFQVRHHADHPDRWTVVAVYPDGREFDYSAGRRGFRRREWAEDQARSLAAPGPRDEDAGHPGI